MPTGPKAKNTRKRKYLNGQPKIDDAIFVPLSEGLEALSWYVAEPVHVDIDLKVVWALHHNK